MTLALGIALVSWSFPNACHADTYEKKAGAIAADALVYRPAGIILTVGGAALFLIALPAAALTGGTKETANTLIKTPFNFTFRRPIGTDLREYVHE